MQNHFQINVARFVERTQFGPRYRHFFTTEVRDRADAEAVHHELASRFSSSEWKITVTEWKASGQTVEL